MTDDEPREDRSNNLVTTMPRALIAILMLPALSTAPAAPEAPAALAAYLQDHETQVAYYAVRLTDGTVLAARDARRPMIPASVQKLCTAAVALEVLGADFQFRTRLAVSGDHVLIIGDGDPTLGDPAVARDSEGTIYDALDAWVAVLKRRGLEAVTGNIVLDDDILKERRHPDWPAGQRQRWYCAPVSGLNFNNNCLDIILRRTEGVPEVAVSPATGRMRIINRLTHGPNHLWRIEFDDDDAAVTFRGTVSETMTEPYSVAVNRPSLLLGRVFADRLERGGLPVQGDIIRRRVARPDRSLPEGVEPIAEHATPLAVVLGRSNKRSLNLAAECLLLRAAAARGDGTYDAATLLATRVLTDTYGLAPNEVRIADGGGLSRNNRLSPAAAVVMLRQLAARPDMPILLDSLPIAGVDGTLERRLTGVRGRVRAKTGTLSGVVTLAGYILDDDGAPRIAMAVFCNQVRGGNHRAREVIDALVADWAGGE